MINTSRFTQSQVVAIIYAYLVVGMSGKDICIRYLDMPANKVGSSRTAYKHFQNIYQSFGFPKKYGGKPWQGLSKGKLASFVAEYWSRGGATKQQMLDYFPELAGPLKQAEEEEGKPSTGTRKSTGIRHTTSHRTYNNYDDDEDDYYEDEEEEVEEEDEDEYVYENPVFPNTKANITFQNTVTKPVQSTQVKHTDVGRQMAEYRRKQGSSNRNRITVSREEIEAIRRTRVSRDTDLSRRPRKYSNDDYYDESGFGSSYNGSGGNQYDGEAAGAVGAFILVAIIAIVLWKTGIISGIFTVASGILGIILGLLELFFFYGGILLAIISVFKRTIRFTWLSCLSMVVMGYGFGNIRDGNIIIGIVLIAVGGLIMTGATVRRE